MRCFQMFRNSAPVKALDFCRWVFVTGELENIKHAEERDQTDAVGQKHQWVFHSGRPWRLSGLRNKAGVTRPKSKEGEKKKVWERYLLSSLSPSQPHRFLTPAFVSLMGSLAHLQIWRQFGSFNTSGRAHGMVCVSEIRKVPKNETRQTDLSPWSCEESERLLKERLMHKHK